MQSQGAIWPCTLEWSERLVVRHPDVPCTVLRQASMLRRPWGADGEPPVVKKCPFCAEQIQDEAIKCRYCGAMFERMPSENFAASRLTPRKGPGDWVFECQACSHRFLVPASIIPQDSGQAAAREGRDLLWFLYLLSGTRDEAAQVGIWSRFGARADAASARQRDEEDAYRRATRCPACGSGSSVPSAEDKAEMLRLAAERNAAQLRLATARLDRLERRDRTTWRRIWLFYPWMAVFLAALALGNGVNLLLLNGLGINEEASEPLGTLAAIALGILLLRSERLKARARRLKGWYEARIDRRYRRRRDHLEWRFGAREGG